MLTCAVTDAAMAIAERHAHLLVAEETARAARFRFAGDREAFVLSRVLLRGRLAVLTGRSDRVFVLGPHGKPALPGSDGLRFSLSHCRNMVACAFADGCEVGADVEPRFRGGDLMALARSQFAPAEIAALERCAAPDRPSLFTNIWAAKEAVAKVTGLGLSMDLASFSVLDVERSPAFGDGGDGVRWTLDRREIGTVHAACAARIDRPEAAVPSIAWRAIDADALAALLEPAP